MYGVDININMDMVFLFQDEGVMKFVVKMSNNFDDDYIEDFIDTITHCKSLEDIPFKYMKNFCDLVRNSDLMNSSLDEILEYAKDDKFIEELIKFSKQNNII